MAKLQRFLEDAHKRVTEGFYVTPHDVKSNGSFVQALDRPDAVIAELKPRSPSEGRLLSTPPGEVLADYKLGGAAALSILTDADHFDGSLDLLAQANATGLPTMMKDFIVDEAQLDAAARCGASAVLLIARCLTPERREDLVAAAHARGLEVLLEVHASESDVETAADIMGVNARDLDTLDVDLPGAMAAVRRISEHRPVVALSGIASRHERQAAVAAGATAVLVGTHLMRQPDRVTALRALRRPVAKVCGIRDQTGLESAIAAGADMVGFIVGAPDSPRNIGALEAQKLADQAKAVAVATVLVTPHEDPWEVREWCRVVKPTWVQLHGFVAEAEWSHSLRAIPTEIMQARRPGEAPTTACGHVFDAAAPGSGTPIAWTDVPRTSGLTLVAGGLDAANAAQAVREAGTWGADASSRLESAPGIKDPEAVRAFVRTVQEAT